MNEMGLRSCNAFCDQVLMNGSMKVRLNFFDRKNTERDKTGARS